MRYSEFLKKVNKKEFNRLIFDYGVNDHIKNIVNNGDDFVLFFDKTKGGYTLILSGNEDPNNDDFVWMVKMEPVNSMIFHMDFKSLLNNRVAV